MQKIPLDAHYDWRESALNDAIKWHDANNHFTKGNPSPFTAFSAGFDEGWRACLSALKLHGYLASN